MDSTKTTELHNLYEQYDAHYKKIHDFPREEIRAYWDNGQPDGAIKDYFDENRRLMIEIRKLERNMESDLHAAFGNGTIRTDDTLAVEIYAALCNVMWEHDDGSRYSCSWRYAGEIVAHLRGGGDYMDWYCSGNEGIVSKRVAETMRGFGWNFYNL